MPGQHPLQFCMNNRACLQTVWQIRIAAHQCFCSLNRSLSFDGPSLGQPESVRDEPVQHIALFSPNRFTQAHFAIVLFQHKLFVLFDIEGGLYGCQHQR